MCTVNGAPAAALVDYPRAMRARRRHPLAGHTPAPRSLAARTPALSLLAVLVVAMLAAAPARARDRGADGRFDTRRSAHFVLRQDVDLDTRSGPRGTRAFERAVIEALEEGYDQLDDLLGLRPRRRLEVMVYDAAIFDATYAHLFPFPAAGFYGGTIRVRGEPALTPRLRSTLHHELVHAALDAAAPGLVLPGWLHEGLAEWFAARVAGEPFPTAAEAALLTELAARGALPSIDTAARPSLARLDAATATASYTLARGLVAELVRLGGERAPARLVALLLRTGDLDHALVRTVGVDGAGLEASLLRTLGVEH